MIVANDPTIKGGAYYPMTVKKHLRAQEIAAGEPSALRLSRRFRRRQPAASGRGVPRPRPFRPHLLQPGAHVGRRASPRSPCVMGSCTAGGAYVPAMTDETIIVEEPGHDLPRRPAAGEGRDRRDVSAPRSSAAATCTPASPASPTRWRATTPTRSRSSRRAVANLNRAPKARADVVAAPRAAAIRPRSSTASCRSTCARHTTCARSSPGWSTAREFDEFKARYGDDAGDRLRPALRACRSAILANNGVLFSESALKGAHFIELCAPARHPAAVPAEHLRLHGRAATTRPAASPRTAPSWSPPSPAPRVPKFTLIVGGSFGAGNYGMCGRAYSPALPVHLAERAASA